MSGELEAAGALATATTAAGVIEGREPTQAGEGACPNCDTPITGRFCSNCGQATHPHRKLVEVAEEMLHGLFHFDTKVWRTLPMVVFRPGTLTRNYVYGKRARYISPLALFLFTFFVMFFAFSFIQGPPELSGDINEQRAAAVEGLDSAREALTEAETELADIRAHPEREDPDVPGLEQRLANQAVELARAEVTRREATLRQVDAVIAQQAAERAAAEEQTPPAAEGETSAPTQSATTPTPPPTPAQTPPAGEAAPQASASASAEATDGPVQVEFDGAQPGESWQDSLRRWAAADDFTVIDGQPELNERVRRQFENPDLALYKLQETAYKYAFLLAPLSLPFIALLFLWKRGTTFYDHIVFALNSLAFASLLFSLIVVAAMVPFLRPVAGTLFGIGLPVHTFFHLGGAYALGWFSALWRTIFLMVFSFIVAIIYIILIFILGLGS